MLGLTTLVAVGSAFAQESPDEVLANARFRLGPLGMTPTVAIRNIGVDTNVFNQPGDPRRDVTATAAPGLDTWVRVGKGLITSRSAVEWNYFKSQTGQRSVNYSEGLRAEMFLAAFRPRIEAAHVQTRQRPNVEIDERVQQTTDEYGAGVALKVMPRVAFDVEARQKRYVFNRGSFGSAPLAQALNRTTHVTTASMSYAITPLTTAVIQGGTERDRFEFATTRNSDSTNIMAGLSMEPAALISGTFLVGFREFRALDPQLRNFSGVVADVDGNYIVRDFTRVNVKARRNVEYSVESSLPYYLLTSGEATITQALGRSWDVVARGSASVLAYRDLVGTDDGSGSPAGARRDRVKVIGLGLGRRLTDNVRVGVDADYVRRQSALATRRYDGFKVGGTLTYGL